MQIFVLILGTVLLSKACALTCYQCIPDSSGSCNQTTTVCPSNNQCGSITGTLYAGGSVSSVKFRNCTTADQCINGSVNVGFGDIVISSICCSSDLCNSQDAPVASTPSPNGKKCFYCDGQVCTGNEDYSITVNATAAGVSVIQKGCASKKVCSSSQTVTGIIGNISCCRNSASSTTVGLLLLVAPLVSLIWIS